MQKERRKRRKKEDKQTVFIYTAQLTFTTWYFGLSSTKKLITAKARQSAKGARDSAVQWLLLLLLLLYHLH